MVFFRLWGENFFNKKTKKWSTSKTTDNERAFNTYILDPIFKLFDAIMNFKVKFFFPASENSETIFTITHGLWAYRKSLISISIWRVQNMPGTLYYFSYIFVDFEHVQ